MASIDTTRGFAAPAWNGAPSFITRALVALRDWNDGRVTRKALSRLTDRELEDIGLCRGDIEDIADQRRA